ncbi:hypothetical protein [Methylovirgula ligni]|uniref:hypothetical protein n=1 Tax=Methylovirgula ligni TaxID=569860 RepID=UPI0013EDEB89|nr:hypothetical protein [Methylovirgula ligni]
MGLDPQRIGFEAFSSEMETGSREENASQQKIWRLNLEAPASLTRPAALSRLHF